MTDTEKKLAGIRQRLAGDIHAIRKHAEEDIRFLLGEVEQLTIEHAECGEAFADQNKRCGKTIQENERLRTEVEKLLTLVKRAVDLSDQSLQHYRECVVRGR